MDTPTDTGINDAKSVSKRVVQKTVEASGDLTGNEIQDYKILTTWDCFNNILKRDTKKLQSF